MLIDPLWPFLSVLLMVKVNHTLAHSPKNYRALRAHLTPQNCLLSIGKHISQKSRPCKKANYATDGTTSAGHDVSPQGTKPAVGNQIRPNEGNRAQS